MSKVIDKSELPVILTVYDIKDILNIGLRQAYELIHSKQFHSVKVGRCYKVSKDVFFSWLENGSLAEQ